MFGRLKLNSSMARLVEEKLYEMVMDELQSGQLRKGIWAKALAQSNGDKNAAEGRYLALRVESLRDEARVVKSIVNSLEAEQVGEPVALEQNNGDGSKSIFSRIWLLVSNLIFWSAVSILVLIFGLVALSWLKGY